MVLRPGDSGYAQKPDQTVLFEEAMEPDSGSRTEIRDWVFANVIRGPINGDLYTLATENHIGDWAVHGLIREGGKTKVLMLTDGYNCNIWLHEWESMVRSGQLKFTGRNHLWQ
jgi:hypothetical protein